MMKRLFAFALVLALLAIGCGLASATESVTQVLDDYGDAKVLTFQITTAADGSVTDTAISSAYMTRLRGYYLYSIETDPGSTAPTADYDVTLVDSNGLDACQSQGLNRSAGTTQIAVCTAGPYYVVRNSVLTLNVDNNSVDSAIMTIIFTFVK